MILAAVALSLMLGTPSPPPPESPNEATSILLRQAADLPGGQNTFRGPHIPGTYFGARYYSAAQGRFITPDWSSKPEPIPYATLDNPQSLNLYSYVRNNPLGQIDPDGHVDVAAICKGKPQCSVTVEQSIDLLRYNHKSKRYEAYSTLKATTTFSVTSDESGSITSAAATSTVQNVSGQALNARQLGLMETNLSAIQENGIDWGFGEHTTELLTALAAKETTIGATPKPAGWPACKDPAINPLQLSGKRATLDRQHNIEGALRVLDWAGSGRGFAPRQTYKLYSGQPSGAVNLFMRFYDSLSETVSE